MKLFIILLVEMCFLTCGAQTELVPQKIEPTAKIGAEKIMIVCLSPVDEFRTTFELEVKKQFTFHNIHSETSKTYLPQTLIKENDVEKAMGTFIKSLPKKEFTHLLLSGISEVEKTREDGEGYFGDFELLHFATHLYKIDKDETSLLWSMCLCVYDYQIPLLTVQDFATVIVERLLEEGVIEQDDLKHLQFYNL